MSKNTTVLLAVLLVVVLLAGVLMTTNLGEALISGTGGGVGSPAPH